MLPPLSLLALCLATVTSPVFAAAPGTFADGGNTLISVMMVTCPVYFASLAMTLTVDLQMFVGNEQKVYFLDKAEGNAAQVNGHPAWGGVWFVHILSSLV